MLIVTKKRLSYTARKSFLSEVRWELVNLEIIPEILVVDSETFEGNKSLQDLYTTRRKKKVLCYKKDGGIA